MNATEMTRYLEQLCEDLDAGRPIRRWRGWAQKLALPAAIGLGLALGGCDSRSTPLYAAPFDAAAEAGARSDGGTDSGGTPLYAAPFDGSTGEAGVLYAAPFDGGTDSGGTPLYAAPFDGGTVDATTPLYAAPFDGG
jgi:hypothetical protein